jgi:hypothetical protein
MKVKVPQFMSTRHWNFLVVSADGWCRGGAKRKEDAMAHANKKIVKSLANGQDLYVVEKNSVTLSA